MYLVLKSPSREEPRAIPIYSESVFRALSIIREVHLVEEAKLENGERRELANALQILAIAALLELQLEAVGPAQK